MSSLIEVTYQGERTPPSRGEASGRRHRGSLSNHRRIPPVQRTMKILSQFHHRMRVRDDIVSTRPLRTPITGTCPPSFSRSGSLSRLYAPLPRLHLLYHKRRLFHHEHPCKHHLVYQGRLRKHPKDTLNRRALTYHADTNDR